MEEDQEDVEVPHLFTCPISLLIMRDPVTAVTGITYDRASIEHWLFSNGNVNATCPVTKQPLPPTSDLTPNHTLRRLIQAWCTSRGVDRIPTPKPPLDRARIAGLIRDLARPGQIRAVAVLAAENDRNRRLMAEAGVAKAVFRFVSENYYLRSTTEGLGEALEVLRLVVPAGTAEIGAVDEVTGSLAWVLTSESVEPRAREAGIAVAEAVVESPSAELSRLRPEFLEAVVGVLRGANRGSNRAGPPGRAAEAAIRIMLLVAPHRNQAGLVEAGAVEELVEAEIGAGTATSEEEGGGGRRRRTELIFGAMAKLCGCAEGRARLARHGAGVAVVAERLVRVSAAVDEQAVTVLSLLGRFSGTKRVVREMAEVGAVSKLCVLMQMDSGNLYVKERARELLKAHALDWKDSPCIGDHHYPIIY